MQRGQRYWMRLTRLMVVALAVGLVGGVAGYVSLASAIYAHHLTHPGCGEMEATPTDAGLEGVQDVTYLSHDGLALGAWYLPPQNGVVIILLPGLGGAREGMLREGAILGRHGYGLLLSDLRSCARPDGQTTLGYREAQDLVEAATWVRGRPGVTHVGTLGYSLGGITSILGAAQDEQIEAVVAEGGFYDLVADVTDADGDPPWHRSLIYRAVLFFFRRETGVDPRQVSPISVIGRISPRPILLIYGDREEAETHAYDQLAQAGEPKELWIVPDCGHGGYLTAAPEEWERRVVAFFDRAWK